MKTADRPENDPSGLRTVIVWEEALYIFQERMLSGDMEAFAAIRELYLSYASVHLNASQPPHPRMVQIETLLRNLANDGPTPAIQEAARLELARATSVSMIRESEPPSSTTSSGSNTQATREIDPRTQANRPERPSGGRGGSGGSGPVEIRREEIERPGLDPVSRMLERVSEGLRWGERFLRRHR